MNTNTITGHLVLVMAPSGSGKGSLLAYARQMFPELYFAVSCTTRLPRAGEREGGTYYFLSDADFDEKIHAGEFLEWAEFGGARYGTLRAEIVTPLCQGRVVIREVELQGILAIKEQICARNRTIVYVDAGGWEVLERRIRGRAPITSEHLALRKERYQAESQWKAFADIVIENRDGRLAEAEQAFQKLLTDILSRVDRTDI